MLEETRPRFRGGTFCNSQQLFPNRYLHICCQGSICGQIHFSSSIFLTSVFRRKGSLKFHKALAFLHPDFESRNPCPRQPTHMIVRPRSLVSYPFGIKQAVSTIYRRVVSFLALTYFEFECLDSIL